MTKVLGIGDNVCDVYLHTKTMYPGGQAMNFAVYARMLGSESDFIGVHGDDAVAQHVLKTLDEKRVGHSHTRCVQGGENGFACVTLVDGDRVFKGSNKGGVLREQPICLSQSDLDYIAGFDVVHTTNNGFLDDELPKLKNIGPLVSYDFSYRWNEEDRVERVCPYIDFGFLSCSNLNEAETWNLCEKLHAKGCGVVVATRGSEGAFVFDGVRQFRQLPNLVKPIDTMGAGDSFATCTLVKTADVLHNQGKDAWKDPEKRAKILTAALKEAAIFSSQTCLVSGAYGNGIPVPDSLWPRIREITQ